MVGANMRLSGYTIFLFAMPLSAALTYTTTERRHRTRLAPHEALKPKREVACLCGRGSKQVEEQDADIMRGVGAFCCALAAVQGAMGFVAPLSARALGRQAARNTFSSEPATRLRMVATDFPKFSVSLMDDTRVSFHMDEEHVRKLAAEVNNILRAFKRLKANAADGGKPYKEDSVEFKDNIDGLDILVECNPNIFPDPFKAQVFVRIWDDKMEVSSQAMLTNLSDAIKQHLALFKK